MDFIKFVEGELKKRNWSASRLCKEAGITRSTFSAMKNRGCQPKPLTKKAILKALDISIEREIENYVNSILERLDPKDFPNCPVNWADLKAYVEITLLITISEASPSGTGDLINFIYKKVKDQFPNQDNINVITEW